MKYYDDGGVVSPEFDTDKQKQLNDFLISSQMKQGMNMTSGVPSTPPASGSPPPPSDMTQNQDKVADSHPGLKPDELTPYIKDQEAQVDTFGPEKQAALMQHLQQGYKSPGNLLAKGGATLADAIMQGVARAGSSGNLAAINERENANLNRTAEMGKSLQEQNLKGGDVKRGLEATTAGTPLGASEAIATRLVAQKMFPGLSKDQLDKLTQNPQALAKMFPSIAEYNKAMAEIQNTAEFRRESLENQRLGLAQTGEHGRAETIQGAARGLESRGVLQKVKDAFVTSPETKALERQAGGSGGGSNVPIAGSVVQHANGSYRFKGGDPADKNNWEKVK